MSLLDNACDAFIRRIIQEIGKDYSLKTGSLTLSKMKKDDLVKECISLGLSSKGSVLELKTKIKEHRSGSGTKTSRSKKVKKVAPVHNHELTSELVKGCTLCKTHGNIMYLKDTEYEIVV
jgi:hypothetical protein